MIYICHTIKKEKTLREIITAEHKAELFQIRKSLKRETPIELALHHALMAIQNESIDSLFWLIHHLKQIKETK